MPKKELKTSEGITQPTNSTLNIYQKLQLVQHKAGQLQKDQLNMYQNYKYVVEYDIFRTIRPLLYEQNLVLTFSDEINFNPEINSLPVFQAEKIEKEWVVKYLKKMILTNADNPSEQITYHLWAPGQNTDIAKAKGSAETYAIKYFLLKFFLIPTSDNLDPDEKEKKEEPTISKLITKKTITPQQIKTIYDLFLTKRGNDRQIQTDFLTKMDKIMVKHGMAGATSPSNFKARLSFLNEGDFKVLQDYLEGLPKSN